MEEKFILSIFTENQIGLLHRVTTIFTRRHINIISLTTSETEVKDIYRFIIVLEEKEETVI
ncbi:MAG: ACT domain-containing protein, partial [Bacteroidetes bacterium]|nr:ACT domain-containing protein [Bacteroidota bacterium]